AFQRSPRARPDQIHHSGGGSDFHGCGPFAHIRITKDHMEPPVAARVHMRLVPRVDQGAPIHRVNAHDNTEKISTLRDLINAQFTLAALCFYTHFSRASKNLSSNEKWQDTGNDFVPGDVATHQVIVVTTVTVPGEIGVVFVEPNFVPGWQRLVSAPRALCKNALACFILSRYLTKSCAFWRGIFRVRVIVVEPGAVGQDEVAFYFLETAGAAFIDLV